MKRWFLLTLVLYLVSILVLSLPLIDTFMEDSGGREIFFRWFVPLLLVSQAALLLVPAAMTRGRPVAMRSIAVSAVVAAIPMTVMVIGTLIAAALMIFGENVLDLGPYDVLFARTTLVLWVGWGVFFYRSYSSDSQDAWVRGVSQWLLRGSILEVVVAIPSHIIARQRNECCAPDLTLLGIVAGLSVALLSFGPGVFFLFAERIRSKRRAASS